MVKFQPLVRTDRQIAIILFAVTAAGYLRMMAPDMLPGDPGEFQFAAWHWGLAHPTGYPLYLLLGGAWQRTLALAGLSPAASLNALNALTGAACVAMLFFVVRFWLIGPLLFSRLAALLAAIYLAVNPTFWSQSLIAEVYPLHVLFILGIIRVAQGLEKRGEDRADSNHRSRVLWLFFLLGLSMTHHGMTLFFVPGLLVYLWLVDRSWRRSPGLMAASVLVAALPLLLYLYIPLRSGPDASPWYHQPLGDEVLTLYANDWPSFVRFISGRSISLGFNGPLEASANVPQAILLWRLNLNWPGIVLALAGLGVLVWQRRWPVLALTGIYALLQQLFNLFYGIGDILVYYIPIYVMATIWIGFAAQLIGIGLEDEAEFEDMGENTTDTAPRKGQVTIGLLFLLLLFLLPLRTVRSYAQQLDQSQSHGARTMWEAIMAADPPANAVLISNDRNEIVPLFYLQHVEGRSKGMTGLFPLLRPDPEFADVGAVVETALRDGGEQPVYLMKEMPGLETKYELLASTPPLVQVLGPATTSAPAVFVDRSLGPLTLLGYDWQDEGENAKIALHWQVEGRLDDDYTTTVQLFDADGEKIGQHDKAPGGRFYPTSLWKADEVLLDVHEIALAAGAEPAEMLIGMYSGPEFEQLAPPIRVSLGAEP